MKVLFNSIFLLAMYFIYFILTKSQIISFCHSHTYIIVIFDFDGMNNLESVLEVGQHIFGPVHSECQAAPTCSPLRVRGELPIFLRRDNRSAWPDLDESVWDSRTGSERYPRR